jgi:hypothetical protein
MSHNKQTEVCMHLFFYLSGTLPDLSNVPENDEQNQQINRFNLPHVPIDLYVEQRYYRKKCKIDMEIV